MGSRPGYEPRRREGGSPGAAVGIFLLTLVVTAVLGIAAALFINPPCALGNALTCEPDTTRGAVLGVVAGVVFVGGMWLAWRVAAGPSVVDTLIASGSCPRCGKPISREMIGCAGCDKNLRRGR